MYPWTSGQSRGRCLIQWQITSLYKMYNFPLSLPFYFFTIDQLVWKKHILLQYNDFDTSSMWFWLKRQLPFSLWGWNVLLWDWQLVCTSDSVQEMYFWFLHSSDNVVLLYKMWLKDFYIKSNLILVFLWRWFVNFPSKLSKWFKDILTRMKIVNFQMTVMDLTNFKLPKQFRGGYSCHLLLCTSVCPSYYLVQNITFNNNNSCFHYLESYCPFLFIKLNICLEDYISKSIIILNLYW